MGGGVRLTIDETPFAYFQIRRFFEEFVDLYSDLL